MDPILGQIILWPGTFIPQGWVLCDGRTLTIQQNAALYSLLGTTYGGDGRTNFQVPDLRSMVPIGVDPRTPTGAMGQKIGKSSYTAAGAAAGAISLVEANLPAHTHTATFTPVGNSTGTATVSVAVPANGTSGTTGTATNTPATTAVLGVPTMAAKIYNTADATTTLKPFDATGTVTVPASGGTVANAPTGSGTPIAVSLAVQVPVNPVQPSLYLNYIMATEGIYPNRPD